MLHLESNLANKHKRKIIKTGKRINTKPHTFTRGLLHDYRPLEYLASDIVTTPEKEPLASLIK